MFSMDAGNIDSRKVGLSENRGERKQLDTFSNWEKKIIFL
jgi:hypothetical protein